MANRTRPDARRRKHTAARRRQVHRQYGVSVAVPRLSTGTASLSGSRVLAFVVFLAMVALLLWFWLDLRFYVFDVEIVGNALVSSDEVYRASLLEGRSIFYVNRADVARNIRESIPGVMDVRVQCQLPARVRISIHEQDVRFIWRTGGTTFLVDGEGLVLKADDGRDGDLIAIQDLDKRPLKPGDYVDRVVLSAASHLHDLIPGAKTFEYSKATGITLADARGWRVYFGDDQQLPQKVALMHALLDKLAREGRSIKVLDLRFVANPYYE
ncbi:MAG: cell division protein FtsQ/DivIB [Anaerolineae bacterium]